MSIGYHHFLTSTDVTDDLAEKITKLLWQLDSKIRITADYLRYAVENSRILVVVEGNQFCAKNCGEIIGTASLIPIVTLTQRRGIIEHVVVQTIMQRKGIGTAMVTRLIHEATLLRLSRLDLTSGPDKEAAHGLYIKLGFKYRETCNYRAWLNYSGVTI